ncbi:MAG: LysM peptidoglycan-binding domain-containing protein, partial [Puia sp.]
MKNRIALIFCLIYTFSTGYSQNPQLKIEGSQGKFYLMHTVVAKENWYSIGRLFNCPPHDIASFNNMNFDSPLEVSTVLNIPLTSGNFDQKQLKTTGESLIPIYHEVGDKEWMYKISSIYNDVPVTSLERWNKIKRDDVKKGTVLIIGYLRVKTDLSPLAMGMSTNPVTSPATSDEQIKSIKNNDPATTQTGNKPAQASTTAAISQTPVKPAVVPNTTTSATTAIPVSNPPERVNNYASTHSNGGFFSIDYTGAGKSASGMAGTFKSTSGWTDGKYYALMNGITVGSIIRVTATNGKTVYAKVLGQLPDMKESSGLLIRISNAASAELGLGEGKYSVDVKY